MASKKSFAQANPAMAYIDVPEDEVTDNTEPSKPKKTTIVRKVRPQVMIKPKDAETKSRRVQILLQPSVYEAVKQLAEDSNTSVNDTINTILKASTIGIE